MSNNTQVITLDTFKKFLETRQMESKSDGEIKTIIEVSQMIFFFNQSFIINNSLYSATNPINICGLKIS